MKPSRSIQDQAAAWLVRSDRGLTAAEQDEFHAWLGQDERHRAAYARERATWTELDALATLPAAGEGQPDPDALAPERRRRIHWLLPLTALAAACIAFAVLGRAPHPTRAHEAAFVATMYERHVLEDGSVAELSPGAVITVQYVPQERRVRLDHGEAHFTVAKNPARPFIVTAAGVTARAVGTAFDVRLTGDSVAVLVTEGRVQVGRTAPAETDQPAPAMPVAPVVAAGERVLVPRERTTAEVITPTRVPPEEVARSLAWQPKLLRFDSRPLAEVVGAFNCRNAVRIEIADPQLAEMPIVASFRSDNPEGFVRLLTATAGVDAERNGEVIVLRRKK